MDETKKCKESVVYFYNNYIRKEGDPKLSDNYFEEVSRLKRVLNTTSPRRWSKSYNIYSLVGGLSVVE